MSYLYRTVNAVISPQLSQELTLSPASLGFLTSTYFLAFGLAQLPLGMLLDRFGPRRVEPALLGLAALGALLFSRAQSLGALVVARGLIGVGVGACLMAPLKAIATWFPEARRASLSGWMMVAGGLGALAATTPLELALGHVGWRGIFLGLAACSLLVGGFIAWRVPDVPHVVPPGLGQQWAGVVAVLADRRFWWIAPLAALGMGSFMAIQSLWAVPWLMEVDALTRAQAAGQLSSMGVVIVGGYAGIGLASTRLAKSGIHPRHLVLAGFGLSVLALFALVFLGGPRELLWPVYALGTAVNVLTFAVLNEGFPASVAARANTALNLLMFAGTFLLQWGIGLIVEAVGDRALGLRVAFAIIVVLEAASVAWFASGFARHGRPER